MKEEVLLLTLQKFKKKSSIREYYENLYVNEPGNRRFEQHCIQIKDNIYL